MDRTSHFTISQTTNRDKTKLISSLVYPNKLTCKKHMLSDSDLLEAISSHTGYTYKPQSVLLPWYNTISITSIYYYCFTYIVTKGINNSITISSTCN